MTVKIWAVPVPEEKNIMEVCWKYGHFSIGSSVVWHTEVKAKIAEKTALFESFGQAVEVIEDIPAEHKPWKFE